MLHAGRWWLGPICLAVFGSFAGDKPAASEHKDEIVLGMSTALSGPAADLGGKMLEGVNAALAEVERGGGVHGRHVRLIALDDGYEPERTGPNVRKLVAEDHVLAVVGNVGTPTAVVALQITNANRTPFYGAFTGAGLLRQTPPEHYVFNYRASYAEEIRTMIDALVDHARFSCEEIAFVTQRDACGDAGFAGGIAALKAHGLKDESSILHVRYERNTVAVEEGLASILIAETAPRAVILVGAYRPCAEFIRRARESGLDALFLNVSFVSSASLLRELGDKGEGVIITQVVPYFDGDLPIAKEYRAALAASAPNSAPGFISLEGYISTRILCRALGAIDAAPDRESLSRALEGLGSFDLGLGQPLNLSSDEHQACHRVWPTVIHGGKVVPFEWSSLDRRSQ
jgi:ABC-type branched-subunit amino acid transport system substrate-binding protein